MSILSIFGRIIFNLLTATSLMRSDLDKRVISSFRFESLFRWKACSLFRSSISAFNELQLLFTEIIPTRKSMTTTTPNMKWNKFVGFFFLAINQILSETLSRALRARLFWLISSEEGTIAFLVIFFKLGVVSHTQTGISGGQTQIFDWSLKNVFTILSSKEW